ncbi:MAG: DUF4355 domain-containing protein [Corynebacterium glucuronolyticum]|nr:DUF4355 domain-containing protein [Corynebacterium glucuronolyticum]MDY5833376.1 DUF4355 domain-containing protein [Corynebacterium glucuronolyticum]
MTSSDRESETDNESGAEGNADPEADDESEENPDARGSKRAVLGDLARERDKRQAAEAERDELKKQLDAIAEKDMTELEKAQKQRDELQTRLAELEKEKADAERKRMIAGVLKKAGLPAEMAGRLNGDTLEELEADAEALATALGYDRRAVDPSQARTNKGAMVASLSVV